LPEQTIQADLLALISQLNAEPSVHGILVQAPLPSHISETVIFSAVSPQKDVDGFHPINVGKLYLGATDGSRSCTPAGVHELLIRSGVTIEGAQVAILGRGNIVGKPMAAILCQKQKHANATVTLLHSRSRNIAEQTRQADIVIAAMGQALFLKADMVKEGAVVVDVGVNRVADTSSTKGYRLVGDVDFENLLPRVSKITPNPGGVGPMTIAMLLSNTVLAAEQQTA
jgi:methylenetetrahydrofolate dehydrogenase (NADP+)/methenyltetrahydrofolate cyclohydrolase